MIVPSPSSPSCTCVGSLISLRMLAALGRVARYSRPVVRRQLRPTWYARNLIGSSDGRCGSSNPGGRRASGHWRSWLAGFHEPAPRVPPPEAASDDAHSRRMRSELQERVMQDDRRFRRRLPWMAATAAAVDQDRSLEIDLDDCKYTLPCPTGGRGQPQRKHRR